MSNEAKVGAFVIVALVIFVATFISVANVQLAGERTVYKTYFDFAGGLESGHMVRFGGLKAGVVSDIRPWEEDPTRIEVLIEMRDDVPVNAKSVARVASLSALGNNYLEVSPGEINAKRVQPGGTIDSIETVTLDDLTKKISDVTDTAQDLMKDVQQDFRRITEDAHVLLINLQDLTGETNQQNIEKMLKNTNLLVEELRPRIDQVTTDISEILEKAQGLFDEFDKVAKSADVTLINVNKTVEETREPLKRDLEELELTLKEARELLDQIQALVAVNEQNVNESIENFRVASQNIEELTDELRQRPWSLIRVKPKPDRQVPGAVTR
jgi:phospholipid/cholesterol/gamma-HCH transport system substrate-binding protein